MRNVLRLTVLALATVLGALLLSAPASARAPYCGITWGSLPKPAATFSDAEFLHGVRAGRHACYDRLVLDLGGEDADFSSYRVRYVPAVRGIGSGDRIPLRGGAFLEVVVDASPYDRDGHPTFTPADRREVVPVGGYRTFRQVAWAGSLEGQTKLGVGVRARLPFRVFVLPGTPNTDHTPRLVIDVAHRW
ncbi:AMIN-like domain-containing (lipo)protein [Geodermatophilus sp. URMC 64]